MNLTLTATDAEATALVAAAAAQFPAAAMLKSVRLRDAEIRMTVDAPGVGQVEVAVTLKVEPAG